MSDRTYSPDENRRALVDAFRAIEGYERQKKDIGEAISDTTDAICARLNISPKALKIAYRYWGMTSGEQQDLDTVLTMAQQALSDMQPDLFAPQTPRMRGESGPRLQSVS